MDVDKYLDDIGRSQLWLLCPSCQSGDIRETLDKKKQLCLNCGEVGVLYKPSRKYNPNGISS